MDKTVFAIFAGVLLLGAVAVGAAAYGPRMWANSQGMTSMMNTDMTQAHDQLMTALENGTYDDLLRLRNETGMPMMHWIQDEETFTRAQAQYAQNQALYGDAAAPGMMGGRRGGFGRGGHGGCPMMDADD